MTLAAQMAVMARGERRFLGDDECDGGKVGGELSGE
jgi:hypothetical protein